MSEPLISVFTPSNNPEHLADVWACLQEQTYQNFEWVVLANGERREDVYAAVAHMAPDARVYVEKYEGDANNVGVLKRRACEIAKGDIFLEYDHDDLITHDCLLKVAKAAQKCPRASFFFADSVTCDFDYRSIVFNVENGWQHYDWHYKGRSYKVNRLFPITARSLCDILYAPDHVRAWTREAYQLAGGHDPSMPVGDDHELMVRSYLKGVHFEFLAEPLYIHRLHQNSTSQQRGEEIARASAATRDRYLYKLIAEWCRRGKLPMLDLGGAHNCPDGFIPVDRDPAVFSHPKGILCDVLEPGELKDKFGHGMVGCIRASDFLEHIPGPQVPRLFNTLYDLLAPGGWLLTNTPAVCDNEGRTGRGAFQDPTHACHSEDTEVFTLDGFKRFSELTGEELFHVLDTENGCVELLPATAIHCYPYDGDMVYFHGRHVDCLVTPNHGMIVGSSDETTPFRRVTAEDCLKFKSPVRMPSNACFTGVEPECFEIPDSKLLLRSNPQDGFIGDSVRLPVMPFVEFFGWWIAEGHVSITTYRNRPHGYRVTVSQSEQANPEKFNRIADCLKEMGYRPFRDAHGWSFCDKSMALYLRQFGHSEDKFLPQWIKQLSPRLLEILLNSLCLGDGTRNGQTSRTYATISPKLAGDVQEVAIKCGYRANLGVEKRIGKQVCTNPDYRAKHDIHLVYISKSEHSYLPRSQKLVPYSGKVYCVTVPKSHVIMTRRNGRVIWSGNSFWSSNNFWYMTRKDQARFVPQITCRFQTVRVGNYYPSEFHKNNLIPYVLWDGCALKDGNGYFPGVKEI